MGPKGREPRGGRARYGACRRSDTGGRWSWAGGRPRRFGVYPGKSFTVQERHDRKNGASSIFTTTEQTGPGVRGIAFSPDGRTLATAGDNVLLWESTPGD